MIPAAYIAKKLVKSKTSGNAVSDTQPDNLDDIIKTSKVVGLAILGTGITYLIAKGIIKRIRKKNTERNFSIESQQAILLRSAINPSGSSWLSWMDGTKEKEIYNVAGQINDFRRVQQDYKNLFNRSLVNDLQKELSIDEYSKFMDIINSKINSFIPGSSFSTGTSANVNSIKGKVILIEKQTKIYEKLTWYPLGSVKTVKPSYFINNLTTGNVKKVYAGYRSILDYVETRVKTKEGTVKSIYVNIGDVRLVTKDDFLKNLRSKYTKLTFNDSDF